MNRPLPVSIVLLATLSLPAVDDSPTRMLEATFKLFNTSSTATGFFVQPEGAAAEGKAVVVTAAHVFKKMKGDMAIVVLRQPQADGTWKRRDHSFPIRADGKDLWTSHPSLDIAAMRIALPADAHVVPVPMSRLATEEAIQAARVHFGSPLLVLGYPTRFEANKAGFPIVRHASVASFPLTPVGPHQTFLADFTTFAGDSGGPVILSGGTASAADGLLVMGLVLSQFRHDEKHETLYEERSIHIPLMLANVVHATYIRETIALLPQE